MNVVSIHNLGPGKESLAPALSSAAGITMYEALSRLRQPGNGPFIISVFSEMEKAVQLEQKLRSAGFKALVLTEEEIAAGRCQHIIRKFTLNSDDLFAVMEDSESLSVPYGDIGLILRGTGIVSSTSTEILKERSISPGRAVLSGGIMITRTTKSVQELTTEERHGFINLYAPERPALVFRENSIAYDGLGPALQPSRALNFSCLVAELRRRCSNAEYDERLLTRPAQAALLGPALSPEEHLIVATVLLARALGSPL